MKNNKKLLSLILVLLFTYILLRNSIYYNYAKYVFFILAPFVIYYAFLNLNTFGKSNPVNSKTQALFKDENLQIFSGLFLICGLVLKYLDISYWKIVLGIGAFFILIMLLRRLNLYFKK